MNRDQAIRYLLEQAEVMGVDLEVLATESRVLNVDAYQGAVSELKKAIQGGVGIRVVVGGRVGYAYSEELEREALDWMLTEARENAQVQGSQDGFLPEGRSLGRSDLLSEGLSAPLEQKVEQALGLERELRRDDRLSSASLVRYNEREVSESVASTRGVAGEYRAGAAGLMTSFVMREGDSVKQGGGLAAEREFHQLDPGRTAQEMLERTGRLLGARPLQTGRYRAYLEPEVVADLLLVLAFALSGKTLIEGKSRLEGQLGELVASELFTLVDDPAHQEGIGNRPFDSEGTASGPVTLIEKGVLRSFLHNSATARKSGQQNTGHASRSYRGILGVAPTNLLVLPGTGVVPSQGVIVTDLMGVHAGANPISGDLSLQAFGLQVEGGEAFPVENFVISANLFQLLERVTGVGEKQEWARASGVLAPMLEVESVSFAGA